MLKTEWILKGEETVSDLRVKIAESLPLAPSEIRSAEILKKALFLRDGMLFQKITVGFSVGEEREAALLRFRKKCAPAADLSFPLPALPAGAFGPAPIVVGAGPCGLFAALLLAEAGAAPLVIERGMPVSERARSIAAFLRDRVPDPESNVQFGEGGAGAFSDGKLKHGAPDRWNRKVLSEFVAAGAPEQILYTVGAHLGTDRLPALVAALREKIISLGGRFLYRTKMVDFHTRAGALSSLDCERCDTRERFSLPAETVILAAGHSARDTYEMLLARGVRMQARAFGIGMRTEHPRPYIDRLVYGTAALADRIGAASYHLVSHLTGGRSVYSFCMCPGGSVVAATSSPRGVVTNGMSRFARDGENSNAALLVSVGREDFSSDSPLAGFELQKKIEEAAFSAAGGNYSAPAVRMGDFLAGRAPTSAFSDVFPTYPLGTTPVCPERFLPPTIMAALRAGLRDFEAWMPGFFMDGAVLTGPETRSTSPVRILRDETFCSTIPGLYPAGEGAGYSGGIVSSAVDGLRVAYAVCAAHGGAPMPQDR